MKQVESKSTYRPLRSTYIAQSQYALVDRAHPVEVEHIDADALPAKPVYNVVKRVFDIVSCGGALVVLSPVMLGIALAIKLDSPGPVLFRQERLGKNGKPFIMHKFRSMQVDAERDGAQWASKHDGRATRVGRFLRTSRLDELPQFFDVVKGDMSLVGPRPERAIFYEEFETYVHGFKQRLLVMPGITGLAQVVGGYDLKPAEKIVYDVEYIKGQSIGMDARIILRTLGVLTNHKGAR